MSEKRSNDRESASRAKLLLFQEVDMLFSENPERVFEFADRKPKKGVYEHWGVCRTQQDILYRIDLKKELDEYGVIDDFTLVFKAQNHDTLSFLNNRIVENFVVLVRKNPIEPPRKKFKCFGSSIHFFTGRPLLEPNDVEMKVYELERFTEQIRTGTLLFEEDVVDLEKKVAKTRSMKVLERMGGRVLKSEIEY